jgi:hypothetical protein
MRRKDDNLVTFLGSCLSAISFDKGLKAQAIKNNSVHNHALVFLPRARENVQDIIFFLQAQMTATMNYKTQCNQRILTGMGRLCASTYTPGFPLTAITLRFSRSL